MIYTCYEMIRDCRDGKPEGWTHFITHYVPAIRVLSSHYFPAADADALIHGALTSGLFQSMEPVAERPLLILLRAAVLAQGERGAPAGSASVELDTLSAAFESLTFLEKQAVWFEVLQYDESASARMLKMDPATAQKVRQRAAELLRGKLDRWSLHVLAEEAGPLRRAALQAATPQCLPARAFLDLIDGRATWKSRGEAERHAHACWHCIDHFCRLREVSILRDGQSPLTPQESAPFLRALGLPLPAPPRWKRLFR